MPYIRDTLMRLVDCNGTRHQGDNLTRDGARSDGHDCQMAGCFFTCPKCGGTGIMWVMRMPRRWRRKVLT